MNWCQSEKKGYIRVPEWANGKGVLGVIVIASCRRAPRRADDRGAGHCGLQDDLLGRNVGSRGNATAGGLQIEQRGEPCPAIAGIARAACHSCPCPDLLISRTCGSPPVLVEEERAADSSNG